MPLTPEQAQAVLAALDDQLDATKAAVAKLDGDYKGNALASVANCEAWIGGLEGNLDRRIAGGETTQALWLKDARECEQLLRSLPADAKKPSVDEALSYVATESGKDLAKLPAKAAGVVNDALSGAGSFVWGALPWWGKGLLVLAGAGAVGFVVWRVSEGVKAAKAAAK